MKIQLRLSDADRKRFGCDEWLELDPLGITAREAAALQEPFWPKHDGFVSPSEWRKALRGTPLFDDHGAPVMVDDGEGGQVQKRRPDYAAHAALVWLALKRAGAAVELAGLDYDQDSARFAMQPDETPAGQGKDDGEQPTELTE